MVHIIQIHHYGVFPSCFSAEYPIVAPKGKSFAGNWKSRFVPFQCIRIASHITGVNVKRIQCVKKICVYYFRCIYHFILFDINLFYSLNPFNTWTDWRQVSVDHCLNWNTKTNRRKIPIFMIWTICRAQKSWGSWYSTKTKIALKCFIQEATQ